MAAESSLSKLPTVAKVGIGMAMLTLTGIAYYVVFYGDVQSAIGAAKSKESQLQGELSAAREAEFAYEKDRAELTERQQRQRELNKVLPPTSEYPAFLSSVQNVANVAGVELSAWTPSPEVAEQFYARVPMKIELVGRYHQVAKFFYGVGQLDRIINLEHVSLSQPEVRGEDVVVKVEALATAFRAVDEKEAAQKVDKRGAKRGQE